MIDGYDNAAPDGITHGVAGISSGAVDLAERYALTTAAHPLGIEPGLPRR
jgi:hypothetical protein